VPGFVLRLTLPDRPGALGLVASRIGAVGGDITAIDILEREDGRAVDEFGVELDREDLVDLLCSEILEVDGVSVEEVRRLPAPAAPTD
jgi:ACT domain-containing protein